MAQETAITFKLSSEEKEVILKASKLLGLGHSGFIRSASLEKARMVLKNLEKKDIYPHINP